LKNFVFTLKNPHNIAARKFPLKAERKQPAFWCLSSWDPGFGGGADIAVSGNCNANIGSHTRFGDTDANKPDDTRGRSSRVQGISP
jgi:hypothetical protein